jgi:ankyrin repeat protein
MALVGTRMRKEQNPKISRVVTFAYLLSLLLVAGGCKERPIGKTTLLHKAVSRGDIDQVQSLIVKGADVNTKDYVGKTPLLAALTHNCGDLAKQIINRGSDINAKDNAGYTPVLVALGRGYTDIVVLLVSEGADVNTTALDGNTLLHRAAINGNLKLAEIAISKDADVNAKNAGGTSPLHFASSRVRHWMKRFGVVAKKLLHCSVRAGQRNNQHALANSIIRSTDM